MDYIREELLRQQSAWRRLVLGGREAQREETENTPPEVSRHEERAHPDRTVSEYGRSGALTGPDRRAVRMEEGRAMAERLARQGDSQRRAAAAVWGVSPWEETAPGEQSALPGPAGQERALAPALSGISRAVEREARRYDGAFSMY